MQNSSPSKLETERNRSESKSGLGLRSDIQKHAEKEKKTFQCLTYIGCRKFELFTGLGARGTL